MGYTTKFKGKLSFKQPPTPAQLAKLQTFFGEDCREHPEWKCEGSYIDLVLTKDFLGLQWDEATEKNNGMVGHVNMIIREMRKEFPDFELEGSLKAQGEEIDDRWNLVMENNIAIKRDVAPKGRKVQCPNCEECFYID